MNIFDPFITGSLSVSSSANISGSLTVGGNLTVNGTMGLPSTGLTISGSIIPQTNLAFDLGSTSNSWRHLYVGSGSIYMNGTKIIGLNNDGSIQLGTSVLQTSASLATIGLSVPSAGTGTTSNSTTVGNQSITGSQSVTGAFAVSGSANIVGPISASIFTGSFTGSLLGTATTASFVTTAQTASFVAGANVSGNISGNAGSATTVAGSGVTSNITGNSTNITAYTINQNLGTGNTPTFAGLTIQGNLTAQQYIVSSSVTYLTESFASGSHNFGDSIDDTHKFTGSLLLTGSASIVGPISASIFTGSFTGSLQGNISGNAATVTTNANLTGNVTSVGNATTIANNVVTNAMLSTSGVTTVGSTVLTLGSTASSIAGLTSLTATALTGSLQGSISGNAATVTTNANLTGNVTSVGNATTIAAGVVTNAMLAGSIADSNLLTISTAGKVSNSATTATSANTVSAIVARDGSGNFSAGTITATLTGNISGNAATVTTNANLTGGVTSVGNAATVVTNANLTGVVTSVGNATSIANGAISNAMLANSSFYVGQTSISLGRASANQGLLGISAIDYQSTSNISIGGSSLGAIFPNQIIAQSTVQIGQAGGWGLTTSTFVTGSINCSGSITATNDVIAYGTSDERLKTNVLTISGSLDILKQIGGYTFDWIEVPDVHQFKGHDIGVIAQEIEAVLPELVTTRENGYKAVKYEKLVALLIETNKQLLARVEALEAKIN